MSETVATPRLSIQLLPNNGPPIPPIDLDNGNLELAMPGKSGGAQVKLTSRAGDLLPTHRVDIQLVTDEKGEEAIVQSYAQDFTPTKVEFFVVQRLYGLQPDKAYRVRVNVTTEADAQATQAASILEAKAKPVAPATSDTAVKTTAETSPTAVHLTGGATGATPAGVQGQAPAAQPVGESPVADASVQTQAGATAPVHAQPAEAG